MYIEINPTAPIHAKKYTIYHARISGLSKCMNIATVETLQVITNEAST